MAGATWRYDYFVDSTGVLSKHKSFRSNKYRPWPRPEPHATWAVSVEYHDGLRTTPGPKWSPAREANAIMRTVYPESTSHDLGTRVPQRLREAFRDRMREVLDDVATKVSRRWENLHTENAMVGVLVGELDQLVLDEDGWSLRVDAQTFSDKVKEPVVGADLGWRVEIREGAQETVKGLLMQAKKADSIEGWERLPDLAGQMTDMRRLTDEAYGLIFTPDGIVTTNGPQIRPLIATLEEAVTCRRGDQNPMVVANTLDAKHVVLVDVSHVGAK